MGGKSGDYGDHQRKYRAQQDRIRKAVAAEHAAAAAKKKTGSDSCAVIALAAFGAVAALGGLAGSGWL